ncbi:MAG TPA: TraR/DksA C4-type zinc finger protein [Ktedonobacterales bacterium]|nr:TraR/DksA C4-type zinc finger protein [Ktedonobacterales bacterium]
MHPELTAEILAELRDALERKRAHLRAQIAALRAAEGAGDTPTSDASTDAPGDEGDESVDLEAWDTSHQEALDLRAELGEIEHALGKFDAGTYGICEECGRPIPLARLRVLPEARYDAQHQAEVEARAGGEAGASGAVQS